MIFLGKDVLAHKRSFPQVSSLIIFDLLGKMHSAKIPFLFFFGCLLGTGAPFLNVLMRQVCGALYAAPRLSCEFMTFSTQEVHWVV